MKHARDLTHEQLVSMVDQVQQILYLNANAQGMIWDPNKEWDCETIEYVAAAFNDAGLKPEHRMPRQPLAVDPSSVNPHAIILPATDEARVQEFFERKLGEWLNDSQEEMIRMLTLWALREGTAATPRIELGEYLEEYLDQQAGDEGNE